MNAEVFGVVASDALWSGVAAAGFAVLFNTPRRLLAVCFLIGAVSHALRALLMKLGVVGLEAGTLAASVVIGFASLGFARAERVPVTTFSLPGAIPMVPGALAFKAMLGVLRLVAGQGATDPVLATTALVAGVKTALILVAIVVGVGSPFVVSRPHDASSL